MTPDARSHRSHTIDCEPATPGYVASYLRVAGDECAFIECYTTRSRGVLLDALKAQGRRPEDVLWIVVTHAHLDHAGGAGALLAVCPNATLLAHPRAARHLIDPRRLVASATSVYGPEKFTALYGVIEPIPASRVRPLEDDATFALGDATLRVLHTAGHAKHHFVVHDPALDTVYTGDAFGLVYPALQRRGTFAIASTSPTDFHPDEARKSLEAILALGTRTACPTHFGEVSDLAEIAAQVRRWIERSERWRNDAAASDAPMSELAAPIVREIRAALDEDARARGLVLDAADWALLDTDLHLNADGIAFVADRLRHAPT